MFFIERMKHSSGGAKKPKKDNEVQIALFVEFVQPPRWHQRREHLLDVAFVRQRGALNLAQVSADPDVGGITRLEMQVGRFVFGNEVEQGFHFFFWRRKLIHGSDYL